MVLGVSMVENMGFKLFKSVSDVLMESLVVLIHFGENFKYAKTPQNALLPYMGLSRLA